MDEIAGDIDHRSFQAAALSLASRLSFASAFASTRVFDECSCSRDTIKSALSGFTAEEITDSIEDGKISVACEFCSTTYVFEPDEFLASEN